LNHLQRVGAEDHTVLLTPCSSDSPGAPRPSIHNARFY
jgi:hypothetical protein